MTKDDTLTVWQVVELARHPERPYALDYIRRWAPDFVELHGDRLGADDSALVGGVGSWAGRTVMFLGQQKGRNFPERVRRNFGMMHPEGYRKAMRLARQAAKFRFPVVCLIDTPGAYPGAAAEERGIAAAIAHSIMEWFWLPIPVVAAVIGEGGSGGAMPEAAASIVWRDNSRKVEVAEQLQITSRDLLAMGVVEEVVEEPAGGAHTDFDATAKALERTILRYLEALTRTPTEELLQHRYERFRYIDSLIHADADFGPKVGSGPA
ncbi:MAG: acetyl-CoA carboxylase carboxyl transferase subunit alpha [Chloroflexi bacterium]|nr:MAG: acetyl-CoA carboxylase carboxyl transferase subunit alpha [Chloroflexota bacterium]